MGNVGLFLRDCLWLCVMFPRVGKGLVDYIYTAPDGSEFDDEASASAYERRGTPARPRFFLSSANNPSGDLRPVLPGGRPLLPGEVMPIGQGAPPPGTRIDVLFVNAQAICLGL